MRGKYDNRIKYLLTKARRWVVRRVIRGLPSWRPMASPQDGYTVVIGCNTRLSAMLGCNLDLIARQRRDNLREVIVVFDRPADEAAKRLEEEVAARFDGLAIRFVYYTRAQAAKLQRIGWAWCYAWLSWCLGMAEARTRWVLLHDFDALPLCDRFFEQRYAGAIDSGAQYYGIRWYEGNGVEQSDRLTTTFEMVLDAAFVRERFEPIDLFNMVTMHNGRSVDFDTLLYAQAVAGRSAMDPADPEDLVHPSQMICQFTHLVERGELIAPENHSLLMIPYYVYLSGVGEPLERISEQLADRSRGSVSFYGCDLDLSRLSLAHARWMTEQAMRVEHRLGDPRAQVVDYFSRIEAVARAVDDA